MWFRLCDNWRRRHLAICWLGVLIALILLSDAAPRAQCASGLTEKGDHTLGVIEMWAKDPATSSLELTSGLGGRVMDGDFVKAKNPQLEFRTDGIADFFFAGVKVSETAAWVDLGTEQELINKYNMSTAGLEIPVGAVFSSVHFNNTKDASNLKNNLVVLKYLSDSRNVQSDSTFQYLKEAKALFEQPTAFNASMPVSNGHVYLLRTVTQKGAGESEQHVFKILVVGVRLTQSVAIRYQVIFGDYSFENAGLTGTSWWGVTVAIIAAVLALGAAGLSVLVLGFIFVSRVMGSDHHPGYRHVS